MRGQHIVCFVVIAAFFAVFASISHASVAGAEPTAAAFNVVKSGQQELYTGDMSLGIPLLTVPGRAGMDFPISLSYSAGISLDEEASWVGLGWNLHPGMISRSVNGEPDDNDNGMLNSNALDTQLTFGDASRQDGYYISFGAGGGAMFFDDNKQFHMQNWKPWKIDYENPQGGIDWFKITTEDGTQYIFSKQVKTNATQKNKNSCYKQQDFSTSLSGYQQEKQATGKKISFAGIDDNKKAATGSKVSFFDCSTNPDMCTDDEMAGKGGGGGGFGKVGIGTTTICGKWGIVSGKYSSNLISIYDKKKGEYTYAWYLTEIRSADYIDRGTPGPSDDDYGNWIKITYDDLGMDSFMTPYKVTSRSATSDYNPQWISLTPFCDRTIENMQQNPGASNFSIACQQVAGGNWKCDPAKVNEPFKFPDPIDLDCEIINGYYYTNKYRYVTESRTESAVHFVYANSIETPLYKARFLTSQRSDLLNDANAPSGMAMKLDSIELRKKSANELTRKIDFVHDYSLANDPAKGTGKLALTAVSVQGKNSMALPPYKFEYGYNPPYNMYAYDWWGYYNDVTGNGGPYFWNENHEANNDKAKAWSLTRAVYPTGGSVNYEYEPDDFNYVQTTPTASRIGGGIRLKSVTTNDGLGNVQTTNYYYDENSDGTGSTTGVETFIPDAKKGDMYAFSSIAPHAKNYVAYSKVTVKLPGNYGKEISEFWTAKDSGHEDVDLADNRPLSFREWKRGQLKSVTSYSNTGSAVKQAAYTWNWNEDYNNVRATSAPCQGKSLPCSSRYASDDLSINKCENECEVKSVYACYPRAPLGSIEDKSFCGQFATSSQCSSTTAVTCGTPPHPCNPSLICEWTYQPWWSMQPMLRCDQKPGEGYNFPPGSAIYEPQPCANQPIGGCTNAGCSLSNDKYIYSGWTRLDKLETTVDNVKTTTTYEYDTDNGLPTTVTEYGNDIYGNQKVRKTVTSYAHDTFCSNPGCAAPNVDMKSKNMLSQPYITKVFETVNGNDVMISFGATEYTKNSNNQIYPSSNLIWNDINNDHQQTATENLRTTFTYDNYGNLIQSTDPMLRNTFFYHGDNSHNCEQTNGFSNAYITCTKNMLGQTVQTDYNNDGTVSTITDANGKITNYNYDDLGRLISVKRPGDANPSEFYTYYYAGDDIGSGMNYVGTEKILEAGKSVVSKSYADGLGKVLQSVVVESPSASIRSNKEYNEIEKVKAETKPFRDAGGAMSGTLQMLSFESTPPVLKTNYVYYSDPLARTKEVIPAGSAGKVTMAYTNEGELLKTIITDENGNITTSYYDKFNSLIRTVDALGGITTYEYDIAGRLVKVTNAKNQVTTNSYDSRGNLVSTTNPDYGTITYTYDNNNNKVTRKANGIVTRYIYDNLNRLTTIDYPTGDDVAYVYDSYFDLPTLFTCQNGAGRLCKISVGSSYSVLYTYDDHGRITKKQTTINGKNYATEYTYDMQNNVISMKDPAGRTTNYVYNSLGQLVSANLNGQQIATYSYNPESTINNILFGNNVRTSYQYNDRSWVTNVLTNNFQSFGQPAEFREAIAYDAVGNVMSINTGSNGADFTYDRLYRMTGVADRGKYSNDYSYTYDALGNRLTENNNAYTYSGNRLTKVASTQGTIETTYSYDANGNLATETGRKKYNFCGTSTGITDGYTDYIVLGIKALPGTLVRIVYDAGSSHYEWNSSVEEYAGSYLCTYDASAVTMARISNSNIQGIQKPDSSWYNLNHFDTQFKVYSRTSATTKYSYDYENRLLQINYPDSKCSKFVYDESGMRVKKIESDGKATNYIYSGSNVIFEEEYTEKINCGTDSKSKPPIAQIK